MFKTETNEIQCDVNLDKTSERANKIRNIMTCLSSLLLKILGHDADISYSIYDKMPYVNLTTHKLFDSVLIGCNKNMKE